MNRAVAERRREGGVHPAVLIEEREPVERGTRDRDLEVVSGSRPVLDVEIGGVGKRLLEKRADRVGFAGWAMVSFLLV